MKRSSSSRGRTKPAGITSSTKDRYKVRVLDIFNATSPNTPTDDLTSFLWRHILREPGRVVWLSIYNLLLYGNLPGSGDFVNHFYVAPSARTPEINFVAFKHEKLNKLLSGHKCCPKRFAKHVSDCIIIESSESVRYLGTPSPETLGPSEWVRYSGAPSPQTPKYPPLRPETTWTLSKCSGSISSGVDPPSALSIAHETKQSSEEEAEKANDSDSVAAGTLPPVLPPSVEEAYKKKCIELKRRLAEVEESNDAFRLRKVRLNRAIRKMRLERALLLENLGKRMRKNGSRINGGFDEDSEGSSDQPPTVCCGPLGH